MTTTTTQTQTQTYDVTVYETTLSDEPGMDLDRARDIRSFFEFDGADDLTLRDFATAYEFVGEDTVTFPEANSEQAAATVYDLWGNNPWDVSDAFREANDACRARTVSVGDLIAVSPRGEDAEDVFLVRPIGFDRVDLLSHGGD